MKDKREIVLFFAPNSTFNTHEVADEIKNHFEDKKIGEANIFPNTRIRHNPLIIFDENPDMYIQVTLLSTSIIISENYYDEMDTIIFDIIDSFYNVGVNFIRLGYVANHFLNKGAIPRAQEKYLNMDNIDGLEEMNIGLYKKIDTKYGKINAWERLITDAETIKGLLYQFDFNSLITEEIEIDMKYIKEFIKVTEEYMELRTNI